MNPLPIAQMQAGPHDFPQQQTEAQPLQTSYPQPLHSIDIETEGPQYHYQGTQVSLACFSTSRQVKIPLYQLYSPD